MRFLKILFVVALCSLISGCVYWKNTVMHISGAKVKAPFSSITPIEGEDISGTVQRQVFWTNEKGREIPRLSDVTITDSGKDGDGGVAITKEADDAIQNRAGDEARPGDGSILAD